MPKSTARLRSDFAREAGILVVRDDIPTDVKHIEPLHFSTGRSIEAREEFSRWFEENKPDVVVSFFAHVYEWIESAGIRIPEDCGFVWTHKLSKNEESWGAQVSGLRIANKRIGEEAIKWLDGKIRHSRDQSDSKEEMLKLIPSSWHEGRSLPFKT
jgi:DNA-binding LacI/PurR family transcriptional regulator